MELEINVSHADICSSLCQRCAACCRILLKIPGTDTRYRRFLRAVGYSIAPPPDQANPNADCCDELHEITIDMGLCPNLQITEKDGAPFYHCVLYGRDNYPQLCADFDCISWAKYANRCDDSNSTLVAAQGALNLLREGNTKGLSPDASS